MIEENIIINSSKHKRPIYADVKYNNENTKKPLIIFVHGFKGFKDWGTFNLMAKHFANRGFVFLKINLSHNGITSENFNEITDKEAFGKNTISLELGDLEDTILYIQSSENIIPSSEVDINNINLMGHSRGGGLVILKAAMDDRINKVITMAAISDLEARYPKSFIEEWKKKGVEYVVNGRTGEELPMYKSLLEDIEKNPKTHHIPTAVKKLKKPLLNFHGTTDETLPVEMATQIKSLKPDTKTIIFEGENHVFGAGNPWTEDKLPKNVMTIIEETSNFIKEEKGS